jgi:hypothetical protein
MHALFQTTPSHRDIQEARAAWVSSLIRDQFTRTTGEVPRSGEIATPPPISNRGKMGRFTTWLLGWAKQQDTFIRGQQVDRSQDQRSARREAFIRDLERERLSAATRIAKGRLAS